jgi:GNAT superfamily N-acetyltransferase
MIDDNLQILDVTRTHSSIIPYFFPSARDLKSTAAIFAAVHENAPNALLGVALLAAPFGTELPPFLFDIKVLDQWRNQGIGNKLVEHVIDTAKKLHAPALKTLEPVRNNIAESMLQSRDFRSISSTATYSFSLQQSFTIFSQTIKALYADSRIPSEIDIIPYDSVREYEEISSLCNQEFGLLTHGHLKAAGKYPSKDWDYSDSAIFRHQGKLIGAWGVGKKKNTAVFDPLLIAQDRRNTWVFPFIIHTVLGRLLDAGIEGGMAQIHQDNAKMVAIMQRIGAKKSEVEYLYELNLEYSGDP